MTDIATISTTGRLLRVLRAIGGAISALLATPRRWGNVVQLATLDAAQRRDMGIPAAHGPSAAVDPVAEHNLSAMR